MRLMNIFPQLARKLQMRSRWQLTATNGYLEYLNITDQVFSVPNKLIISQSKAIGLDKISARLIRERADLICVSFCKIFNCSLTTGIFPDDWKCDKVTPLFKQGSSSDMNNYRPISVISVVAKGFERITCDHLYAYLSQHSIS